MAAFSWQTIIMLPRAYHAAIVAATLIPLYGYSYYYHTVHPSPWSPSVRHPKAYSGDFVEDWLSVRVGEPFIQGALSSYCDLTTWNPNMVFNVDNANGGIGNVRGNILDFVFVAIEVGASIILPKYSTRAAPNLANVWAAKMDFDHYFDEEWFIEAIGQACPQMVVHRPGRTGGSELSEALPGNWWPSSRRMDAETGNNAESLRVSLQAWLQGQDEYKPEDTTVVDLERTLFEIDTRSLPLGVRRNFGQILHLPPTIRQLAATVVKNMNEQFYLNIDPRIPVPRDAFFGAHLRTEEDAAIAGWTAGLRGNFSAQTDAYIAQARKTGLNVIYVASGSKPEIKHFSDKARSLLVTVVHKGGLLSGDDLTELNSLSWDQQALVDYEVLLRCSVFGGFVKSSFSYNVALTRGLLLEDTGEVVDPWFVMHVEEDVAYDDGLSRIWGRDPWHEQRIPRGMWP